MFQFSANLFRIAYQCASNESTRYYLNGVFVEPAKHGRPGVTMTTTDGHRLISIYDESGKTDQSAIISLRRNDGNDPNFALKACKGRNIVRIETGSQVAKVLELPKYWSEAPDDISGLQVLAQVGCDPVVRIERRFDPEYGIECDVTVRDFARETCFIDGTFPDYARVVPSMPRCPDIWGGGFNGALVADFGKIAGELAKHFDKGVGVFRLLSSDPTSPALIQFPSTPEAFGVLMPMRCETDSGLPEWYWYQPPNNVLAIPDMRVAA